MFTWDQKQGIAWGAKLCEKLLKQHIRYGQNTIYLNTTESYTD